ncbi:MAG: addiction module protein [Verrucomicrobia bacterium]|nr:addiction module protein [Verrucomicrobiota bacterium]
MNDESQPIPAWHKELLRERPAAYEVGKLKTMSVGN